MSSSLLILIEAFYNYDDIDKTIDSIIHNIDSDNFIKADIIILENPSPKTTMIFNICYKYKDRILMHLISNKNIEGNIFTVFINQ